MTAQANRGWQPPQYTVDADGKLVGAANDRRNNWGRWGDLDERGTTNLLTPERVAAAAGLIRTGQVVSCAIPLDSNGPVHPSRPGITHLFGYTGADFLIRSEEALRFVGPRAGAADDYVFMPLQGSTQWDGLSHMFLDGVMYNGFWMGNVDALHGARRGSIDTFKASFVGRGVLLDVARHLGVDRIPKGHAITPDELDATAAAQGVAVGPGDLLLVRTGHVPWFYQLADKAEFWKDGAPGLGNACLDWIADRDIGALAMDNVAITVQPTEPPVSIHTLLLVDLGLPLGEIWWLEDLAAACAAENRYEFFLVAPPLNVARSAGAPLNPVAIL